MRLIERAASDARSHQVPANYTVAESVSTRIPKDSRLVQASPRWHTFAAEALAKGAGSRSFGAVIADHRSSWVRRGTLGGGPVFVKTYQHGPLGDLLRTGGRWASPWGKSRASREFQALNWLRENGFSAPEPLAVLERRRVGFLTFACLVTEAHPGVDAEHLLPTLAPDEQAAAIGAVVATIVRLHTAGFRDGNLDLRNLLLARVETGWQVAKIDSPRYRLRRPGAKADAGTLADWQRLWPQLAAGKFADTAMAALDTAAARSLYGTTLLEQLR